MSHDERGTGTPGRHPVGGDRHEEVGVDRRHLLAVGYRMLGTLADAEDAVQEAYVRWYRMSDADRAAVRNPQGWFTRVTGRVCLDALGSARARRERYVGEWLPEPVPVGRSTAAPPALSVGPADRVLLGEDVSTALLVVMEAMTPAERVAFVLHDVFDVPFPEVAEVVGRSPAAVRQLATSARRRVRSHDAASRSTREHDAVVSAFASACAGGDLDVLAGLLDPSVTLRSDGGGVVGSARRPVQGASDVARFLVGVLGRRPAAVLEERRTGDGLALAVTEAGAVRAVVNARVRDGRVSDVWIQVNPHKLTAWSAG